MKTNYRPAGATLHLSNGNASNWRFAPQTVMIDDVTDYIVGMYLDFSNGDRCNLLLLPKDTGAYQATQFAGDVLASVGAQIIGSQVRVGNAIIDNAIGLLVEQMAETAITNMFRHALHAQCAYFAIDNGEMVIPKAMTAFDLRDV